MRLFIVMVIAGLLALCAGCNTAKDTAKTAEKGGAGAVGVAEKMKGGTMGNADADTGESSGSDQDATSGN
jgi:hypothetical protein